MRTIIIGFAVGYITAAATITLEGNNMRNRITSRLFGTKKRKIATVITTLALVGGGTALAAWLIHSNGAGSTRLGSLTAPTVTAAPPASPGTCFPGGECDAVFTINNPNAPLVVAATVNGDGTGFTSDASCPFSNLTVNNKTGLTVSVPSGSSTVTVPGVFHLSSNAPTECQSVILRRDVDVTFATP